MLCSLGSRLAKFVAVLVSLVVIFVIHQLSFAIDSALPGPVSELLDTIDICASDDPEALNNPESIAESEIPRIVHQIWENTRIQTYSHDLEAAHELWKNITRLINYTGRLYHSHYRPTLSWASEEKISSQNY